MQAIIQNKDSTLLLDIPYRRMEIYEKLGSIGIWNPQGDIFIRDNEGEDVRVKLSGSNDLDNHLLGFFDENTTLATVNNACEAVYALSPVQREWLENGVKQNQYSDVRTLIGAALTLKTQKPGRLNVNYFYDQWTPAGMISARLNSNSFTVNGSLYDDHYIGRK